MTLSVVFVCVRNSGKSQMAAALLRRRAGAYITAYSAGTHPGDSLNTESVAALNEVGVEVADEHPRPVDPALLDSVDRVVLLGTDVQLDRPGAAPVERWVVDEPSLRGISGTERMRLVLADIDGRVASLVANLTASGQQRTDRG